MPRYPRKVFAVECEHGWFSVLAYHPHRIKTWMLQWYNIYNSDGQLVEFRK